MPLPSTLDVVRVTARYVDGLTGNPASGTVTFIADTAPLYAPTSAGGETVLPMVVKATLDASGAMTVQLPATDDPDIRPVGWRYRVVEDFAGGRYRTYQLAVPYRFAGSGVDLVDLLVAQGGKPGPLPTPQPPVAAVTVTMPNGDAPPAQVDVDAAASVPGTSPIASFTFFWGDGSSTGPQTSPSASHIYTSAGTWTVQTVVIARDGQRDVTTASVSTSRAPSAYDITVLGDSPVAYWTPDAATAVVADRAGRGLHGEYVGGYPAPAVIAGTDVGVELDGAAMFLEMVHDDVLSIPASGALTVEAWIRPAAANQPGAAPGGYVDWIGKGGTSTEEWAERLYNATGTAPAPAGRVAAQVRAADGTVRAQANADDAPAPGQWTHVVAVFSTAAGGQFPNGYVRLYKNGALRSTTALPAGSPSTGGAPLRIGTHDLGSFFKGGIGKVAVYGGELAAARVAAHWTAMTGQAAQTPPVARLTLPTPSGPAPVTLTADASASSAAAGIASYTFDWGDGTSTGPQPGPTAAHQFTGAGTWTVRVTVRDQAGMASTATATVTTTVPANRYSAPVTIPLGTAGGTVSGTPVTIAVPAGGTGVPVGALVGVAVVHDYSSGAPVVTDSRGNTYVREQTTLTGTPAGGGNPTARLSWYTAPVVTALQPADTITVTGPAVAVRQATAVGIRGAAVDDTRIDKVTATAGAASTGPSAANAVATTQPGDIVIGVLGVRGPVGDVFSEDPLWNPLTRAGSGTYALDVVAGVPATATTVQYQPVLGTARDWASIVVAYKPAAAVAPPAAGVVFEDTFSGTGAIDTSKWRIITGTSVPGGPANFGTGEIETNVSDTGHLWQDGAVLHIKATRDAGGAWQSARIETVRDDFRPALGSMLRAEARITLPASANLTGVWPAFWALGEGFRTNPMGWPGVGELDFVESVNGTGTVYGTMHAGQNPGGAWNETTGKGGTVPPQTPSIHGNWHVYAFEWDRSKTVEELRWYCDANNYFTLRASDFPAVDWERAMNHGYYLILDLAIGGAFPNGVAGAATPDAGTTAPVEMLVDYVRVTTTGPMPAAARQTPFADGFTGGGTTTTFNSVLTDNFSGTDGAAWAAANWTGGATPAGGGVDINANAGRMRTGTTGGYSDLSRVARKVNGPDRADVDVTGTIRWGGGECYPQVLVRGDANPDGGTGYQLRFDLAGGSWDVERVVAYTGTTLGSTARAFAVGTLYRFRLRAEGTSIRARVWLDGAAEPTTWDVAATDTAITSAGSVGLLVGPGGAAASTSVWWDGIVVSVPTTVATTGTLSSVWQTSGGAAVSADTVRVPVRGDYAGRIDTTDRYDMRGKSVTVKAVTVPANASGEAYLQAAVDASNYVAIGKSGTNLILRSVLGGVVSNTTVPWSAAAMLHWRIAVDGAGAVTWATSPDRVTWTTRRTLASGTPQLAAAHLVLLGGHYGPDPDETAVFDDVAYG